MTFLEKLANSVETRDSLVCVGLDPELERLPTGIERTAEGVLRFNRDVIEATRGLVCAYKPNLAFYESLGPAGLEVFRKTVAAIPRDIVVIGDAKRGDIGNTARHYARAFFEYYAVDAVTVNPYLGQDSLEPFFDYADRGVFVLCRTSNPGAIDLQSLPVQDGATTRLLYEVVAERARGWNRNRNAALVIGATATDELARLREIAPELPFLIPGIGAQAGDLSAAVATHRREAPAVISASRSVLYASSGADFAQAAERAAREMRDSIRSLQSR